MIESSENEDGDEDEMIQKALRFREPELGKSHPSQKGGKTEERKGDGGLQEQEKFESVRNCLW